MILLVLLIITKVQAMGILSAKQTLWHSCTNSTYFTSNPEIGLFVNEKTNTIFEYQSYTGINFNNFFSSEHYLLLPVVKTFKVGIGPTYGTTLGRSNNINDFGVKAYSEIRLW